MKVLADPSALSPTNGDDDVLQVIIETPAKSRNKFAFDPEQGIFSLKKTLPAGMVFPYDFGFVPKTKGDDGDPVDVLLLMDEPAHPGVAVKARILGVIEGEQLDGKKKIRNDRLVAVAIASQSYASIQSVDDLPKKWLREVGMFFVNYHKLEGKEYRLLGCKGPKTAKRLVTSSQAK
ncbi:inorganic diphosphatase [Terriglobus albidus]|uniref:inorganic diphosphatase n=1 Tax=Terriglobus albidus TaxID=1592106 RepID=UPI0021DF95C3|nr:inorganic diphosphatase [Terriglobus albidus]